MEWKHFSPKEGDHRSKVQQPPSGALRRAGVKQKVISPSVDHAWVTDGPWRVDAAWRRMLMCVAEATPAAGWRHQASKWRRIADSWL